MKKKKKIISMKGSEKMNDLDITTPVELVCAIILTSAYLFILYARNQ